MINTPSWRSTFSTALCVTTLMGAGACHSRGRTTPRTSIEVRNTLDVGVSVYVMPNQLLGERFVGQVGPRNTRRVRVDGLASGARVRLRAVPVDGRTPLEREDVALGPRATWQIP